MVHVPISVAVISLVRDLRTGNFLRFDTIDTESPHRYRNDENQEEGRDLGHFDAISLMSPSKLF